jgi:serine/arginine repetitive matrix protein 2
MFTLLGSDESIQDAPTPIARPIEIPPLEKLHSFSPVRTATATAAEDPDSDASSPPTPVDAAPSFELSTPPRPSLSSSKIKFETPPPPKGLPELPGPPSSSEDETESIDIASSNRQSDGPLSLNGLKTPRVPGAWAATPAPARSQTPQPTSSSFAPAKLSRARSNSLPQTSFTEIQSSTVAPSSTLSRAGTLPVRTPAPPGGWFSTPGSLRRKSLMKVRFDNMTSDSAISDADSGVKDGKVEVPLPVADWDAASSSKLGMNGSQSMSEPSFDHVEESSPAPGSSTLASRDGQEADGSTANAPPETDNYTTVASSPRRKSRRSPSVRLVDEYGRAQEDQPITPSRQDVRDHSASLRMPGGGPLKTPRSASVRIVDAMGHEVEEPSEQNDSEDTVTEVRYSRQEALQRMKRAVADLQNGLKGVDT